MVVEAEVALSQSTPQLQSELMKTGLQVEQKKWWLLAEQKWAPVLKTEQKRWVLDLHAGRAEGVCTSPEDRARAEEVGTSAAGRAEGVGTSPAGPAGRAAEVVGIISGAGEFCIAAD